MHILKQWSLSAPIISLLRMAYICPCCSQYDTVIYFYNQMKQHNTNKEMRRWNRRKKNTSWKHHSVTDLLCAAIISFLFLLISRDQKGNKRLKKMFESLVNFVHLSDDEQNRGKVYTYIRISDTYYYIPYIICVYLFRFFYTIRTTLLCAFPNAYDANLFSPFLHRVNRWFFYNS